MATVSQQQRQRRAGDCALPGQQGSSSSSSLSSGLMGPEGGMDEEALQELYAWIDTVPLSRPKRNIARDFSDGVMVAELVKHFFPRIVEMHNYIPANSVQQKISNWNTLNRKVLSKLCGMHVPLDVVRSVTGCSPGVVELVLHSLRLKLQEKTQDKQQRRQQQQQHHQQGKGPMKNGQDVEYYSTNMQSPARSPHVQRGAGGTNNPANHQSPGTGPDTPQARLDPEARLLLQERDQALRAAQETVLLLQAKVQRLEQLVQIKDARIAELTKTQPPAPDRRLAKR
ncbi:sperm flagellar protein 1 isoform X1 [Lethenteron reissneri]|uniref:sperm flagellar protein 1 isoform X1 n=2 Tax=Lethenteron reissneri TaxID=7753 RepID=UPI002AB6B35D|nr:sperm flagellar protein 1 isoform X1 [Lethenteron reissneri]